MTTSQFRRYLLYISLLVPLQVIRNECFFCRPVKPGIRNSTIRYQMSDKIKQMRQIGLHLEYLVKVVEILEDETFDKT